ncbi:MAG TPA: hypothetical protein VGD81_17620 [Opitutaceae bacterium]
MNNGNLDAPQPARTPTMRNTPAEDALARTKRELLQAEVRLAKARATAASAEIDVKVLTARLKTLAK